MRWGRGCDRRQPRRIRGQAGHGLFPGIPGFRRSDQAFRVLSTIRLAMSLPRFSAAGLFERALSTDILDLDSRLPDLIRLCKDLPARCAINDVYKPAAVLRENTSVGDGDHGRRIFEEGFGDGVGLQAAARE